MNEEIDITKEELEDPMVKVIKVVLDHVYSLPKNSRSKTKAWRYFKRYIKSKGNWKDLNRGTDNPQNLK